ncbi:zona pellucida sperm-binding protein 4 isoform X2 [Xenopus tropicalis]|uniref:Zona pellucida sperm-binding protein 4 isoform X2 n=1 Tax=Xenopus tropicalis TaxID=8364 RepID=A0A8J1J756_XENTR|nr:zona pellucida sperm-binding protein 4 isoform X2 [Xenopus tropicalis]
MAVMRNAGYCWSAILLGVLGVVSLAQDLPTIDDSFYDDPDLICGDEGMEYSASPMLNGSASLRILVQEHDEKLKILANDSSCGIWVTSNSNGSLLINVHYDGCYITKKGNYYAMTLFIEHNTTGEWEVYQKEDLRCPFSQAMDAPALNKCSDVQKSDRFPCAIPTSSSDLCHQRGCCYDQNDSRTPCYYDNKVTAQCTQDGQFSLAISKYLTQPPLILSSVRFPRGTSAACSPVAQNNAYLLFQFPLTACGTTHYEDGPTIIYENNLVAEKYVITWNGVSISRESTFRLTIQCRLCAASLVTVNAIIYTPPPPLPASSSGLLTLEMRIAKEVRLLDRNDPALTLILEHCWANPSENPTQQPQWPILTDRCPSSGDNYKTELLPISLGEDFPLYYKRFIVKTFTFITPLTQEALNGFVYLHCSASICTPSSLDSCMDTCTTSRTKRTVDNLGELLTISAQGPVEFQRYENKSKEMYNPSYDTRTEHALAAVGLLFGSITGFIILVWTLRRKIHFRTQALRV